MSLIINHANSILSYNAISKVQTSHQSHASGNRIGVASDDALSLSPSVTANFSREAMALLQSRTTQGAHSASDLAVFMENNNAAAAMKIDFDTPPILDSKKHMENSLDIATNILRKNQEAMKKLSDVVQLDLR